MAVVIDNFRLQEAPQASAHSVMTRVRMTDSVMMITACRLHSVKTLNVNLSGMAICLAGLRGGVMHSRLTSR